MFFKFLLLVFISVGTTNSCGSKGYYSLRKSDAWKLTGKMYEHLIGGNIYVRDHHDRVEITIAADTKKCEFSVNLKPISNVFPAVKNLSRNRSIPEDFTTYDIKSVTSFQKNPDMEKSLINLTKAVLSAGLRCACYVYKF